MDPDRTIVGTKLVALGLIVVIVAVDGGWYGAKRDMPPWLMVLTVAVMIPLLIVQRRARSPE